MDYTQKSDAELEAIVEAVTTEQARRTEIASIPGVIADLVAQWEALCPDNPDGWQAALGEEGDNGNA